MMEEEEVLLESRELANDLSVAIYDLSRKVAADRWLVRIRCVARTGLPEEFFREKVEEGADPDLVGDIREKFGGAVSCEMVRELNFVDEQEKDRSITFLMESLRENSIEYMNRESFLRKLLAKQYDDFEREILTRRQLGIPEQDDGEDDEGPADFSACFRD